MAKGQLESTSESRRPIKVILPEQGAVRGVPPGGSSAGPFRPVDSEFRNSLGRQVAKLRQVIVPLARRTGSAPMRVKLLPRALAKTHRPDKQLFSEETCPIVGAGRLGELFLKATPEGLNELERRIQTGLSQKFEKELSAVEAIEPITAQVRRGGVKAEDILRRSPRSKKGFLTRVRLFDFGQKGDQERLSADFFATAKQREITVSNGGYSPSSYTFEVECRSGEDVEALSNVIGVRSVTQMPLVRVVQPKVLKREGLPESLPEPHEDLPVVVVVDSGISQDVPELESWVVGRDSHVAPQYENTEHGTFVAGLICWGQELNPTLAGIDESRCRVFDLQVQPNADPAKGPLGTLTESELLQDLTTALQDYANKYKVWNISLGTSSLCSLSDFSPLAVELDKLQERYKVTFVISAGNYDNPPLLDYPRKKDDQERGRITSPADSVLGVTVGSVSHVDYKKNGPKEHHPSAFSRHGAGPNHIIKPDLVHYGGSCSRDVSHVSGVRSVAGSGTAENLGTSFAAPLVSRTLANTYHQITPTPSPVLARALLTHHARDPRSGARVPDGEENYFGFGLQAKLPYCLECTPHSSTLVFEDTLRPRYYLEWDDFPYPPSLRRGGRYFGEVWMTVAFSPSRGERWGSEYCETHIEANFGVYYKRKNRKTGVEKPVFRGLVPPEHKNKGELHESFQVEQLRKWAPVRTYYGNLGEKGERGDRWRLKLRVFTRHGIESHEAYRPQPFSLIVTIADPEQRAPVYDEMVQTMRSRFQTENLNVRTSVRARARL